MPSDAPNPLLKAYARAPYQGPPNQCISPTKKLINAEENKLTGEK